MNKITGLQPCPVCGYPNGLPWLQAPDRFHLRKPLYCLTRCPSCSLVWLQDPPRAEEIPYHYGADYHKSITSSGETDLVKRWRAPRSRVLSMVKEGTLLDIGCSSGAFLQSLKGDGLKLCGIEISPDEARRAELTSGAKVFVGQILDADFSPETFDIITCFDVLEHVHQVKQVVTRVREWLKPGGIFYVIAPNIEALEARAFRSYWYGLELPRHLYHFAPAALSQLFTSFGFEEILLRTLPACYVEQSFRYILDNVLLTLGISRTPLAAADSVSILAWRVIRKAFRLGVLWPFRRLAAAVGHGGAIEAAFRKNA